MAPDAEGGKGGVSVGEEEVLALWETEEMEEKKRAKKEKARVFGVFGFAIRNDLSKAAMNTAKVPVEPRVVSGGSVCVCVTLFV